MLNLASTTWVLCYVVVNIDIAESYSCFDLHCTGEDCLYTAITDAGTSATTCTAAANQVCYIHEINTLGGVQTTAGCGRDCTATTPASPEITTYLSTTSGFGIVKRRKRSAPTVRRECCTENLCNHDSSCGSLTCSGGFSAIRDHTLSLYLFVIFMLSMLC